MKAEPAKTNQRKTASLSNTVPSGAAMRNYIRQNETTQNAGENYTPCKIGKVEGFTTQYSVNQNLFGFGEVLIEMA